jgi:predicted AlkP superfamily pyrophosphatase or phosphodiesterase
MMALAVATGLAACSAPPFAQPGAADRSQHEPILLLVSLDGFRWDYLDRFAVDNLSALAADGVRADGLIPVFPTQTFPNHYTIVTGLYPEQHGIVANTIYDPDRDAYLRMSDRDAVTDPAWWNGEPIWVTAEKHGLRAATFFWPGSEAPIAGISPTYWKEFDQNIPPSERVDQVLAWLDLPPGQRPSFISLYFGQVDRAAHAFGLEDPRMAETIDEIDAQLGRLTEGLRERELFDHINIIVVSDHGMTAQSPDRVIFLDDYLRPDEARVIDWSPVLALRPGSLSADSLYRKLVGVHPHLTIHRREEMPARLHYSNSPRIAPIIGVADEGWSITRRERFEPRYFEGATHGYDNVHRSMQGIFVAQGPAFARGIRVPALENIHLYALMADILGVTPAENNGSLASSAVLRYRDHSRSTTFLERMR